MRELKNTCRAAIVQATPVMFDKARSLEKALTLIVEAARYGAELIVFPVLFLPGYPLGMTFGGDGQTSHILDPRTGAPLRSAWRSVTISTPSAALADALSTAACLMASGTEVTALCAAFPDARVEALLPV